jgi:DNA replication protein DnaC
VKHLHGFDFTFQPSLRREQIEACTSPVCRAPRECDLPGGPPGVGKTHLAISLAIAAAQSGRRVYYGTLADLITSLKEAQAAGWLQAALKVLTHPALLVVDEIGYLPISRTGAILFFPLMTAAASTPRRCSRRIRASKSGGEIFGDDLMAAALLDRLVPHGHDPR